MPDDKSALRFRRSDVPAWQQREVRCPACGAGERRLFLEEREFPIWRCLACGHTYVSPQPSAEWLQEFYASSYLPDDDSEEAWEGDEDRIFAASLRAVERSLPRRGDLLDVGAGFGGVLARAAAAGWRVHGVEPNASAYAVARKRLGAEADLQQATFEDARLPQQSMDCVIMLNVIEHVPDPFATCRRAFEVLRPGGCLALRWPQEMFLNLLPSRLGLRRFGPPYVLCVPAHLHEYSRSSMETMMTRSGFGDIRHVWGGLRRYSRRSLRVRVGAEGLGLAAQAILTLTHGRWFAPFGARLTLARKPGARATPGA